jgi:hypothetical protein
MPDRPPRRNRQQSGNRAHPRLASPGSRRSEPITASPERHTGFPSTPRPPIACATRFCGGPGATSPAGFAPPAGFEPCFVRGLGQALNLRVLESLAAIYRDQSQQATAQALTDLGSPVAVNCGHMRWVPELVAASKGLDLGLSPHRACRSSDLRLKPQWGAALGSFGGTWRFVNLGAAASRLDKGLGARVVGPKGNVVVRGKPNRTSGPPTVVLQPHEVATAVVLWSNWCGPRKGTFRVQLVLPNSGGVLSTRAPGPATCTGPASTRSKISVSDVR